MRIGMVLSIPIPPQEGIGFYIWNLSHFLMGQGHQVQIITRGQAKKPVHEVVDGIPIWRPRFIPIYPLHVHLHGIFVQKLVDRLEPEIDVYNLHTPLPPPIRSKHPILLTVHSLMLPDAQARKVEGVYDLLTKLQSPVSSLIEERLIEASQKVTAVSPPVAEGVQRRLDGRQPYVEVMWNGVDASFFSPGRPDEADPHELLYVGRLAPGKGLLDLLEAFRLLHARFPDLRLSIAGDGPLYATLSSHIEQNGLDQAVRMLGHVSSRETLRMLYRRAWSLILSSHHESMPGVILEAMACGTPVIATRVGGVAAVIRDGENGLLVPPRSPEKLAQGVCALLERDGLRNRLSQPARESIEKGFTWQAIGGRYLKCYTELLGGVER